MENSKPQPLCPIKWWPFNVFAKLHVSTLLIAEGAVSGLRQFLATENLLNVMKNAFYFTLKVLFVKLLNFYFDFLVM